MDIYNLTIDHDLLSYTLAVGAIIFNTGAFILEKKIPKNDISILFCITGCLMFVGYFTHSVYYL